MVDNGRLRAWSLLSFPETSKQNYAGCYDEASRCPDGRMYRPGVIVDESSGSTGRPYNWVRGPRELKAIHRNVAGYVSLVFPGEIHQVEQRSLIEFRRPQVLHDQRPGCQCARHGSRRQRAGGGGACAGLFRPNGSEMALPGSLRSDQQHDPVRPFRPAIDERQSRGVGRAFEKIIAGQAFRVGQGKRKLTRLNAAWHASLHAGIDRRMISAVRSTAGLRENASARFDRAHVPHPLDEIEGYGCQSKDCYKAHQNQIIRR